MDADFAQAIADTIRAAERDLAGALRGECSALASESPEELKACQCSDRIDALDIAGYLGRRWAGE